MSRMTSLAAPINQISCAYLYYSLYSNGFLKSKPITLGANTSDITNKMMHLCKSSINKKFKDRPDMIYRTSFSGNYLTAHLSTIVTSSQVKKHLLTGYVNILNRGFNEVVNDKLKLSFANNSLSFVMSFFGNRYSVTDHKELKARLDGTVEAIMIVPNVTNLIIEYIDKYLVDINDRDKTLFDLYIMRKATENRVDTVNIDGVDIELLKDVVLPDALNTNEYFNSICPTYSWDNASDIRQVLYNELREHGFLVTEGATTNE